MLAALAGFFGFLKRVGLWESALIILAIFAVGLVLVCWLAIQLDRNGISLTNQKKWGKWLKDGLIAFVVLGVFWGWQDQKIGQPIARIEGNSNKSVIGSGNTTYMEPVTVFTKSQTAIRSFLIPAGDPMPNVAGHVILTNDLVAFVGNMTTEFPAELKSFSLIQIGGEDVLSIEWNSELGIVSNAILRDERGRLVATITKNVFHSYAPNDFEVKSDDHQILILNSKDEVVLYVRYLNARAIRARGIFNHPPTPTVKVEDGRFIIGTGVVAGDFFSLVSRESVGKWYQLRAVLVIP